MTQNSGTKERLQRLIKLVVLLQTGRRRCVADLSVDLEVSRRTIFRDIALLRDAGLPIVHQTENGGIWLMKSRFKLPRIRPEDTAMLLMAVLSSNLQSLPAVKQLTDAFVAEVLEGLSTNHKEFMLRVMQAIQFEPPAKDVSIHGCLASLVKSIETRKKARLWVCSQNQSGSWSTLSAPLWLELSTQNWKVFAHSSLHQKVCGFHIENLERVQLLDEDFDPQTIRRPRDQEAIPIY
ncbi:Helix-turn-helix type 11 domain protein [Planctopirus limnophila DSM 3776]|uniref:Helix-turn-helix type 11 domain protein n=1 Tax=Planctopirus limnophila (strain ATCC 43296 / DSM 3776 / IFAM 1008 / Mu 290) TaxID=521674 RepID=D5SST1_PLAL2|nr:Helix-turn-helix type 11 domain protein [Planctopirus limnophila DSM 3776]